MSKSTISMTMFNSYVCLPEGTPNNNFNRENDDLPLD